MVGIARRFSWRIRKDARRIIAWTLCTAVAFQLVAAALPPLESVPLVPLPAAAAETLAKPQYVAGAVMPNGQVGLIFANGDNGVNTAAEIRFLRYTSEHAIATSLQLSTAGPNYPQLTVFKNTLVAGYVDSRSPNDGKFIVRTSSDNGATWSAESNPFGSETFDRGAFAPRLVGSRDGNTLYLFSTVSGQKAKYRSTTSADLTGWSTAADVGDASIRTPSGNNCGSAGQECYRAHAFSFMETATAGRWLFITKSDSGY